MKCDCGHDLFTICELVAFPRCQRCQRYFGVPDFTQEEWDDLWCCVHQDLFEIMEQLAAETSEEAGKSLVARAAIRQNLLERIHRFRLPVAHKGVHTARWELGRKTHHRGKRVVMFGGVEMQAPLMSNEHVPGETRRGGKKSIRSIQVRELDTDTDTSLEPVPASGPEPEPEAASEAAPTPEPAPEPDGTEEIISQDDVLDEKAILQ